MASQGMTDCDLFGLAVVCDGEYLFVDPDNKLSKYAPKNWRASHTHGLDVNGKPLLVLYFQVQFYVDSPLLLRDGVSRHHYYKQLRHNICARGLQHACSSPQLLYLLAGYALQADLGDPTGHPTPEDYFQPADYFPPQMCSDPGLPQTVAALHRDNAGLTQADAELFFIREASSAELWLNAHLYRLRQRKSEMGKGGVCLAICARGIDIHEENSAKALTATFLWNNIGKLCFDRKKFEIRALNSGDKYTYYTNSDEKSKQLLYLCRVTHQFSMAIQPRLSEVRRREEEERKRYRDCYMYSRSLGPDFPKSLKGHHSDQRISVISNTSSNTTSGIVSDRVQSLDESEDDLEVEIMINSPPAPSVESLALAHLTEDCSQGDAVDGCSPPHSQKPSPTNSSGPGGAATPATTDGSQCSSSCSTVVVASTPLEVTNSPSRPLPTEVRRRASTSSSLELGYSHTAQNSAVSDTTCFELDYSVQSAHASSGIYTLGSCGTSGTHACSSETSGVYAVCSTDSMAGASDGDASQPRCGSSAGSIISASGSFRGDGSDPSDAAPRNLLTAEELSDLIVGRGSGHASGVYPSRATVSSTLDSDSDYVTLPPPPMPPPRTDSDSGYAMLEPVPMTTVRTVTPVTVASSAVQTDERTCDGEISPLPPPVYSLQPVLSQQALAQLQAMTMSSSREQPQQLLTPLVNLPVSVEEANARFITTKPHINILTAHTSLVATTAAPSFAAPTLSYQSTIPVSNSSMAISGSHQLNMYPPGDARTHPPTHIKNINTGARPVPLTSHHVISAAASSYMGYTQMPDPGAKMKASPVQTLVPIIGKNNYLDVHASRSNANAAAILRSTIARSQHSPSYVSQQFHQRQFSPPPPPPPVLHPRQPPPPPPTSSPSLATVYTSQVTRSQIEQFQQQMYSDVDYVIYPMKDPAISKQEYMDAKQGSLIAHAAVHYPQVYPPPPYPTYHTSPRSHYMYRSTPNVAVASGYIPVTFGNSGTPLTSGPVKYASNQNLSSCEYPTGYPSPYTSHYSSPLYSAAASYSSSSTQSLRYDPHLSDIVHLLPTVSGGFSRARSDDNILNSYEKPLERPRYRRLPPPPPPPPYDQQITEKVPPKPPLTAPSPETVKKPSSNDADGMLDIRTLREKSKNLDLPLISALCNDRSLLKQTNAFVMPRHPVAGVKQGERPVSWHMETTLKGSTSEGNSTDIDNGASAKLFQKGTLLSSLLPNRSISSSKHSAYGSSSNKLKYPVSGLSTTQISKPQRKVSASTHTHPHHVPLTMKTTAMGKLVGRSSSSGSVVKHRDTVAP